MSIPRDDIVRMFSQCVRTDGMVDIEKYANLAAAFERVRLAAVPIVLNATPEQLAELREAFLKAPPMPLIQVPAHEGIPWTVIVEGDSASLPPSGEWLVTVDTDSGREVHVLMHEDNGKWRHEGEFTFQHGYFFRPIAWAPRPPAFDGEIQEEQ